MYGTTQLGVRSTIYTVCMAFGLRLWRLACDGWKWNVNVPTLKSTHNGRPDPDRGPEYRIRNLNGYYIYIYTLVAGVLHIIDCEPYVHERLNIKSVRMCTV